MTAQPSAPLQRASAPPVSAPPAPQAAAPTPQPAPPAPASIKPAVAAPPVAQESASHSLEIAEYERENRRLLFARDLTREFVQSTGSMKKVMNVVFFRVLEVLEAEAGSLWMLDAKSQQNICHLAEGPAKDRIVGLRLPLGKGIVGKVIENNHSDVVLDCSRDARFEAQIDKKTGFSTQSMICVPLADRGVAFGAIQIINKKSGFSKQFNDDDRQLVEDLSLSAAIAVRNARLLETESRVKEMNTLMEVSRQVVSTLDLDQVLTMTANMANELASVSSSAVGLLNETKNSLFIAVLSGGRKADPDDPQQQQLLALMEQVKSGGRTSYIADIEAYRKQNDAAAAPWLAYMEAREIKAIWANPLADEESTLGIFWLESDEPNFASGSKSDMLFILATQATVALRNASLFQRIPLSSVLGKASETGQKWRSGWRRVVAVVGGAALLLTTLHYLPVFRSVSGDALVEARFGRGVYLPVEGRVSAALVQEGDWVTKGDVLANLDDTPIRLRLVQAESKLAILERQIIEAKATGDTNAMSRAAIERIAAHAEMRKAKEDLEMVEVRAPMDGVILTPRPKELIGRDFPIGAEILRLADPKQFTVVVKLPEEDLLDVKPGQTVRGVLRSRPGMGFDGEVRHVGRAYAVPAEALEEGVKDTDAPEGFVAEITIKSSDVELLPGMTGQASIYTPETSVVVRYWRRWVNFAAFWFGL